jgi:hypothetical protein
MVGASATAALGLLVSLHGAPQQQTSPSSQTAAIPRAVQPATSNESAKLYKKLFHQASPEQRQALTNALKRESAPRVLCGLTLLPADPSIDQSMSRPLSRPTVEPKVRRIEPAICRGDESIR